MVMGVFIAGKCWFLSCFVFNRARKAFLDPRVILARRDSQVLKACLDHRGPRYVSL